MNTHTIRKFKWFWVWQDEAEEKWLTEMSHQGFHLKTPKLFGEYIFTTGDSKKYTYRLDFITSSKKNEDYYLLFQDAGWEHVGTQGGWQYWRKAVQDGETAEIYSDAESKIEKYRRVIGYLVIFLPILTFNVTLFHRDTSPSRFDWLYFGGHILSTVVLLLLSIAIILVWKRIQELKKL